MSLHLHLLTIEVLVLFVIGVHTQCGPGFAGPDSSSCIVCPVGTYKGLAIEPLQLILKERAPFLYTSAENWDPVSTRFTDLSGNGLHGAGSSTVTVGSVTGNGAGRSIPFAGGPTSSLIRWPAGSIPSTFTICSITRYSGATRSKILACLSNQWLHGHSGTFAGAINYLTTGTTLLSQSVSPNTNWVIACGRNTASGPGIIVNGVIRSTAGGGTGNCQLSIEGTQVADRSDWQLSKLYIWNTHLSDTQFLNASELLNRWVLGTQIPTCENCPANSYNFEIGRNNITDCLCNIGYTGPNGGPCTLCPLGTYKNTSGNQTCTACPANSDSKIGSIVIGNCTCNAGFLGQSATGCITCPENTYALQGSPNCSTCPARHVSVAGSIDVSTCCLENTTAVKNNYHSLSLNGKNALSVYYAVKVEPTPTLGFRSMTSTAIKYWGSSNNIAGPVPSTIAPTYVPSGGYNNKAYISFRSTPKVQVMDAHEIPIDWEYGLTLVFVVRFVSFPASTGYMSGSAGFFGMKFHDQQSWLQITLAKTPYRVCIGIGGGGNPTAYSLCSSTVPFNEWLRVTFTYSGHVTKLSSMRITYLNSVGTEVVVYNGQNVFVAWGLEKSPTRQTVLNAWNTLTTTQPSYYVLGYSAEAVCFPDGYFQFYIRDFIDWGRCPSPEFDLAGFYLYPTVLSNQDISLIMEAIGNASNIAFDTTDCRCNPGFGGSSRSNCVSCTTGKYKQGIVSETCLNCPHSTYSTTTQATDISTCTACPENTGASCSGCNAPTACTCNARFYGPNGGPCLSCPSNSGASCSGCTVLTGCMCDPGFTGPNGGPCTACPSGSYKIASGSAACTNCTSGQYSPTVNATAATTCLACPANSVSPIQSSHISQCTCAMGYTGQNGGACTACVIATYKNTTGNATCTQCPTASTSPVASIAITACTCNLGFTGPNGNPCTACLAGTYKTATGTAVCTNCLANQYSANLAATAASTCLACPVNSNSPIMSVSIQNCSCNLGFTGPNGGPCTACPALTFKNTTGTAACTSCRENTGLSCSGCNAPTACTCNARFYGPNGGPCLSCPSNSGASCSGCTVLTGCMCNPGFTGPNGGNCTACPAGTYKTTSGSVTCTTCAAGTFSTAINATIATTCLACPANSGASCSGCPTSTSCTCNQGFTGPNGGPCSTCPVGTFKATTGNQTCTSCSTGTYSATTAVSTCLTCPVNSNSPINSQTIQNCTCNMGFTGPNGGTCSQCVIGTFKSTTGSVACTVCSAGKYSVNLEATTCLDCTANSNSPVSSTTFTSCTCNMGYTGPGGPSDPVVNVISSNLARSCGVASNTACLTSQSTTGLASSLAVDNNVNTISQTGSLSLQWFSIDFGKKVRVTSVELVILRSHEVDYHRNIEFRIGDVASHLSNPLCYQLTGALSTLGTATNNWVRTISCTTIQEGRYFYFVNPFVNGFQNYLSIAEIRPRGSYNITPPIGCFMCVAGTYKNTTGSANCTACPANMTSPNASPSIAACILTPCNAGYTGPSGGPCVACVAGKYKSATGNASCTDCVSGTYSTTIAATSTAACVFCPNNTFSAVIGSSDALVCQSCQSNAISAAGSVAQEYCYCKAGYAHAEGEFRCNACTPGTYNSQLARKACSNCTIGMYSVHYNATGPETCQACPTGQWSPEGSANCNLCPPNSNTLGISGLVTDCVCDAGYTGPSGSTCTPCASGQYKDATGSAACTNCGSGTYSTTTGATAESACVVCSSNSGASCTGCPAAASCTCNIGYTGPDGGVCSACISGKYKSATGSSECIDCGPGTYLATEAATAAAACLACPADTTSPTASTSSAACISSECNAGYTGTDGICSTCAAGTYKVGIGSAACTSCVAGKYSTTPAATAETACLVCPVDSDSPSQSSVDTACTCNAGYSGPNGGICSPCAAGTYKNTTGPDTCTSCPSFSGEICISCVATSMCVCTAYTSQTCTACVSASPPASTDVSACVCGPGQYDSSM